MKPVWTQVKTRQTWSLVKNFCCFYHQSVKSQKCSPQSLMWGTAAASADGGAFATEPELRGLSLEVVLLWLQNPLHLHKCMTPFLCFKCVSWFMWLFPQAVFWFCLSATLLNPLGLQTALNAHTNAEVNNTSPSLYLHLLSVHEVGTMVSISFAVRSKTEQKKQYEKNSYYYHY